MEKNYLIDHKLLYKPSTHTLRLVGSKESIVLAIPASLCLYYLLKNQGKIFLRDELLKTVWGSRGMNVTSNTLYQNISLLRKSLVKLGISKSIIQTVSKRGFVFSNEVSVEIKTDEETTPELSVVDEIKVIPEQKLTITSVHGDEVPCYHNEGITTNDNQTKVRNSFPSARRLLSLINTFFIIAIIILIFCVNENSDDFNSYRLVASIEKCNLYINNGAPLTNQQYIRLIKEYDITCHEKVFVYLTNYPPSLRTSLITCDKNISEDKNSCHSYYKFN